MSKRRVRPCPTLSRDLPACRPACFHRAQPA
jgi:hypothetical protein